MGQDAVMLGFVLFASLTDLTGVAMKQQRGVTHRKQTFLGVSFAEESCQTLAKDRALGNTVFEQFHLLWADEGEDGGDETARFPIGARVFMNHVPEHLARLQAGGGQTDRIQDSDDLLGQALTQQGAKAGQLPLEEPSQQRLQKPGVSRVVLFLVKSSSDHER